jgi:hypothetical protein
MPDGPDLSPPYSPPSQPPRPDYGQQPGSAEGWGFPPAYLDSSSPAPVVSRDDDSEKPPTDFDG